jgi:cytochrome c
VARCLLAGVLVMAGLGGVPSAQASAQLALDKGCLSCHGAPPRRNTPSLDQLATDYARYRGQPEAVRRLAAKLRAGSLFGHIAAHERLSEEECEKLVQWLIDGAP